ncbi:MAG: hypothetical protein Q9227_001923 [Pyrenula ochraceoflavens]
MAQEARITERHGPHWPSQNRLRNMPVGFVAATHQEGQSDDGTDPIEGEANTNSAESQSHSQSINSKGGLPMDENRLRVHSPDQVGSEETSMSHAIGNLALGTEQGPQLDLESSSSDSDDIVLFRGRAKSPRPCPAKPQDAIVNTLRNDSLHRAQNFSSEEQDHYISNAEISVPMQKASKQHQKVVRDEDLPPTSPPTTFQFENNKDFNHDFNISETFKQRSQRRLQKRQEEEDAIFQDYIDNLRNQISETEGDIDKPMQIRRHSWTSADLQDFEDLPTSDEEMNEIECVLSRRERDGGVQYLVYASKQSPDEARWIPVSRLQHATTQLQAFDATEHEKLQEMGENESTDGSTSDEQTFNDLLDDIESEEDEQKAMRDRSARMTDSQIARALAKQEELGLPADEILIYDGTLDDEDSESDDDVELDLEDREFRRHRNVSQRPSRSKAQQGRLSDGFPSATAFADALEQDPYGAFDVMDFERPSLKRKPKGRHARLDLDGLEDEDLMAQIQEAWENDREKKKAKKQERQRLRELGLLGQKDGRVDMAAKYPHGMQRHHIKAEIKVFLLSPLQSIAFPPMLAPLRAFLHQLAKKVSIKSKSQGSGNDRFPILTKTKSTPPPDSLWEQDVEELLSSTRTRRPRVAGKHRSDLRGPQKRRKGAGGTTSGAFYLEGEIVGAAAPEIGVENRGRAMLEKMGWTSGTALGKMENKGILLPVEHVVKVSKAGLG